MTKEMIQAYFFRMKDRRFDPNRPFCKKCNKIAKRRTGIIKEGTDINSYLF
ncbi:MAG: hypothetical protein JSV12_08295 [Candidatus Bathyarchaeota archaeon]|nr:MAG: hypothetical protein JSV12_08295 [Candidatus Bathyarchaeota archaeon]